MHWTDWTTLALDAAPRGHLGSVAQSQRRPAIGCGGVYTQAGTKCLTWSVVGLSIIAAVAGCTPRQGGGPPGASANVSGSSSPPISPPTNTCTSPEAPGAEASSSVTPSPQLKNVRVGLRKVANVRDAIALAVTSADPRLFVASRRGKIYALDGLSAPTVALNLSREAPCCDGESGLLGLAFSPTGGHAYVSFVGKERILTVSEFEFLEGSLNRGTRRDVLRIPQPSTRHHGGNLVFGPDGNLWIATGDGSLGFDPTDDAQSLGSLRGKLLRIDPRPADRRLYRIPEGNPFAHRRGARPEIYAFGLRNPWRFSFDRSTGDIWIGDVGQYILEEIDFLPAGHGAGANFGWNRMEGSHHLQGKRPRRVASPLTEYGHDGKRCAVIGGYVYRGAAIKGLQGAYVYGDFCDGTVRALVRRGDKIVQRRSLPVRVQGLASFGEDANGELYVLSVFKGVFRLEPSL
jgi:glucose/arabinose dehydrogenase